MAKDIVRSRRLRVAVLLDRIKDVRNITPHYVEVKTLAEYRSVESAIVGSGIIWKEGQDRYPESDLRITTNNYLPRFIIVAQGRVDGLHYICSRTQAKLEDLGRHHVEITASVFPPLRVSNFEEGECDE